MKSRVFAILGIATVLALGVSAPAFASQSYTGALSDNSCAPGGSVQYTSDNTGQPDGTSGDYTLSGGQSGALGAPVVDLASIVTHSIKVGSHSHLTFTVKIPTSAKPGSTYTLNVRAGKFSDTQSIKIVGVPASIAGANLTWLWITIAVVILIALFLSVLFVRRRHSATAAA